MADAHSVAQPQSIAPASDKSDAMRVYSITGVMVNPPTCALPGSLCSGRGHRLAGQLGGDDDNFVIQCRDPCRSPESDRTIGSVIRGSQPCSALAWPADRRGSEVMAGVTAGPCRDAARSLS